MRKLQRCRINRVAVALMLVFAMGSSVILTGGLVEAAPIDNSTWAKISSPELESAMGSYGTAHSIVEYDGKVYAGGLADPENTDYYSATVYSQAADGGWELVSPDLGAGEDSRVTHMTVFQNKLYVAVGAASAGALQLWTHDSSTSTWAKDSKFTLNDGRMTEYITHVLGMKVVGGDKLCATTVDLEQAIDMAVMCTDGTSDWVQLSNDGLEDVEFTSNYFTNLFTAGSSNSIGIVVDYETESGAKASLIAGYSDVDDPDAGWLIPPAVGSVGAGRVISAMELYIDEATNMGGVFAAVVDADTAANVEIWEVLAIGMPIPLDETLRSSYFLGMQGLGTEAPIFIITGTDSNDMAVIKYFNSLTNEWYDTGPAAAQVGPEGENPAEYVTALTLQDNGDIFLALQGSSSLGGNSTLWYYDASGGEDDMSNEDDDSDEEGGPGTTRNNTPTRTIGQADSSVSTSSSDLVDKDDELTLVDDDSNPNQSDTRADSSENEETGVSVSVLWWLLALPVIALLWWMIASWIKSRG